ncbi:MAG: MobA/MobL family protein [Candidatus Dormibacteraeota bacterium]|nr:MobA/MobL family protein [Candidatus Dormibacteraeota bacterium]
MRSNTPKHGRTATAAAAYRACTVIECDREGRTHDYRRKRGHEAGAIVHHRGAVARWLHDRMKLWNGAEMIERNGKRGKNAGAFKADARVARDLMFTYPAELSKAGRFDSAMKIARYLADNYLIGVDFNIHEPGKDGDERNYHCHMLTTTRRMTADGFGAKVRELDDGTTGPAHAKKLRAFIAQTLNDELKAEGKADVVFVEHRSFKARGSAQVPTRHMGQHERIKRQQRVRATKAWTATQRRDQKERHAKELAALKLRQDFALQGKLASLAQRGRDGEAAIRAKFAEQRRADTEATGMRRVFQIVTGREGREAPDRQTREARRTAEENRQIQGLIREVQAARNEFVTAQQRDRAALIERHGTEDRQLSQTATSREFADKAADRAARQPVQRQTREQERGQDRGRDFTP